MPTPHNPAARKDLDGAIARAIVGPGRGGAKIPATPAALARSILSRYKLTGDRHAVRKAAERLGVAPVTFRRWARTTDGKTSPRMRQAYRRANLSKAREAKLRARSGQASIRAVVKVSNKTADHPQNCHLGKSLPDLDVNGLLIDAYLSGKPGEMTTTLNDILDQYSGYVGMEASEILEFNLEGNDE